MGIAELVLAAIVAAIAVITAGVQLLNWLHKRWLQQEKIRKLIAKSDEDDKG